MQNTAAVHFNIKILTNRPGVSRGLKTLKRPYTQLIGSVGGKVAELFLIQPFEKIEPDKYLARLGSVGLGYQVIVIHRIDQLCGPSVADAQAPLQE